MSVLTATPLTAKPMTAYALVARRLGEGVASLFNPATLFANNEKGAYFDASNSATLFQESTGTTPVTAVGQPVGLMQDLSGNGNDATQSTSTARPLWARVPEGGRRNLLPSSALRVAQPWN